MRIGGVYLLKIQVIYRKWIIPAYKVGERLYNAFICFLAIFTEIIIILDTKSKSLKNKTQEYF